jgi:hypothetical protein
MILLGFAGFAHIDIAWFTGIATAAHIWGSPQFGVGHLLMAEHTVFIGWIHEKSMSVLIRSSVQFCGVR